MVDALLPFAFLVNIVTLLVAIYILRSSRRSEALSENRHEFLRDQQERLRVLREERQMLVEKMKRESRERQQLMAILKGAGTSQLAENLEEMQARYAEIAERAEQQEQQRQRLERELRELQEDLERERRGHQEAQQRAEELEQEHENLSEIRQEMQWLEQERQRLTQDLKEVRGERAEFEHRAEQWDQERVRLERNLQRLQAESDGQRQMSALEEAKNPVERYLWQRRPVLVVGLLLGTLAAWFVSLMVALSLLTP